MATLDFCSSVIIFTLSLIYVFGECYLFYLSVLGGELSLRACCQVMSGRSTGSKSSQYTSETLHFILYSICLSFTALLFTEHCTFSLRDWIPEWCPPTGAGSGYGHLEIQSTKRKFYCNTRAFLSYISTKLTFPPLLLMLDCTVKWKKWNLLKKTMQTRCHKIWNRKTPLCVSFKFPQLN